VSKAELRAVIRASRRARPEADRVAAGEALARHAATLLPSTPVDVTAYLSMPTEPGTDPLVAALHAAGHVLRVPRIEGRDLRWVRLLPDSPLASGPMGIREPRGEPDDATVLAAAHVLFLPGLAVDHEGGRMGQGGGFYDRTLAAVPTRDEGGPLRVIVLFDDEIRDDVPVEPHDCRVDAALTPGGVVWFGPRGEAPSG
jgi:5-formyltetrahydrofolate cyclo-ligase